MRPFAPATQLELFRPIGGDIAARDAQDLMAWPFFSLAKSRRCTPIDFTMGATWISVEAVPEHGMATIWDADILIWAASQLVEARDAGRPTSRLVAARPHEILNFIGRGTGKDHYERLRAALDRLQSTTVATSKPLSIYWMKTARNWSITPVSFIGDHPFHGKIAGVRHPRRRRTQIPAW